MYCYAVEREKLFTDEGQRILLKVRDHVAKCLERSGAVTMHKAMRAATEANNTWEMMAYVDRLVELGELREITDKRVAGQDRVFVAAQRH